MKRCALIFPILAVFLAVEVCAASDEEYPLRAKFPKVKYITTESLNKGYSNVIIVDVRSKLEFDVIHINSARHIPVTTASFGDEVKAIRARNPSSPIIFYCNGHECAKSYEAAELAISKGISDVAAYDSGIYDWVQSHPEKTTLMGKTPAHSKQLISKDTFKKHTLKFAEFMSKTNDPNALVIDIREPFQRKEIPPFPNLRNIPTDRLVRLLEGSAEFKRRTLLITDAVGKQVEWLQYYLEKYGYTNYYFLENGVLSTREASAVKIAE